MGRQTDIPDTHYGEIMYQWCRDLFPLCRSITGQGIRDTLTYFQSIAPGLKLECLPTGEQVFDWTVPEEWVIRDAYIEDEAGNRYAEFSKNNLHILNYSCAIDKVVSKDELDQFIWTQPDQPERIPYVTSYYKRRSGFCMSQNEFESLPEGNYRLFIDADHIKGQLDFAELILPGSSQEEVLISSYVCHPSMANNELSGPCLAIGLAKYLKERYPDRSYTYRIVLVPETIGAIAYLSKNLHTMKENTVAGFVLSCVGDEGDYSSVASRFGKTLADEAIHAALKEKANYKQYSYLHRGSDERQYCAPGVDLPVVCFCRTKFGEFPEYHTDADNLDYISPTGLQGAFDVMKNIIDSFEIGLFPRVRHLGEPQLGRRKLRSTLGQKNQYSANDFKLRMNTLSYADGETNIFQISKIIGQKLSSLNDEVSLLKSVDLLQ